MRRSCRLSRLRIVICAAHRCERVGALRFQGQSEKLDDYLQKTTIIDFDHQDVADASERFKQSSASEADLVRRIYDFVRDEISHSADINAQEIPCKASEVLTAKHGICFAKSHLLAALCRANGIPAGFCYQKLRLTDEASPLVLHGLNAVYISGAQRWIRLDARGNKPGVNAQFSLEQEMPAFPISEELGEIDFPMIYAVPDANVVGRLTQYKTRDELWADLPRELAGPHTT
jgi:transglutaminase-like putative cysteine protease